jgi:hypothetical protein
VRFLSESLALLEEIASRADTRPQVAAEILESLEPRLALLSDTRLGFGLTPERKKAGVELRGPLKAVMDSLRRPRTRPLEQEPRWSRFRATWERAQALLAGKAAWPEAKAGWEALLASLDEAARRLDSLGADGTLGEGEILWVRRQYGPALDGVRKKHEALRAERMTAKDPNNPIPVTSTVVVEPPEVASLNRLKRLLPALEKMAAQERVRAEIVLEISGTLDPDLDRLARLPGHRDSDTVKRAKALLAIIKSK